MLPQRMRLKGMAVLSPMTKVQSWTQVRTCCGQRRTTVETSTGLMPSIDFKCKSLNILLAISKAL